MNLDSYQNRLVFNALRAVLPGMADDERPEAIALLVKSRRQTLREDMERELAELDAQLRSEDFIDHCSFGTGRYHKPENVKAQQRYMEFARASESIDLDDDTDE